MNNARRPSVRAQFHPTALAIIERHFVIEEGYNEEGAPRYMGIPSEAWLKIAVDKDYPKLLAILSSDFPTYAAAVLKIWAKRIGQLMPFIFNKTQWLMWNAIAIRIQNHLPLFFCILKARQLGLSTLVNGLAHWHVWRLHDIEVTLVGHEKPLVYSFIDRLRIFHEELPKIPGIERTLRQPSKLARVPKEELFYNETRSKVTTVVAKSAQARGRSAPHYHFAEYAFYDNAEDLLAAVMPQLPSSGTAARLQCSVFVESTPNGKNDFYTLCESSKLPGSEWSFKFFPWYVSDDEYAMPYPEDWEPGADTLAWAKKLAFDRQFIDGGTEITWDQLYWYEVTLETEAHGDQDYMDREYPSDAETCFLLRSRSIFKDDMRYLQACVKESEMRAVEEFQKAGIRMTGKYARGKLAFTVPDNPFGKPVISMERLRLRPKFQPEQAGYLTIWSPPQKDHEYVIGIDTAAGTFAGDWSTCEVIDVDVGRQVAEIRMKASPEDFTDICVALGYYYNTALLYPEINSIGVVVMKRAKQVWFYPKMGREEKWDEVALKDKKYGFYMTEEHKQIIVSFFKHVVQSQYLAIASDALLAEMSTFVESAGGSLAASGNNHDDLFMAMAVGLAAVRQSPRMLTKFTRGQHQLRDSNAVDSMTHQAPVIGGEPWIGSKPAQFERSSEERKRLPPEIRALLDGEVVMSMPSNPISGGGIDGVGGFVNFPGLPDP